MDFNLPAEMLQHVFSYLSADELCRLTGQVCKYWHNLSYDPILWKAVRLNGRIQSPDEIMRIAKSSSLARRLLLSRIPNSKWKFLSELPECKNLRSIEFSNSSLNETRIRNLVQSSPLIERVRVENSCSIDYTIVCQIVKWINLKTLKLHVGTDEPNGNKSVVLIADECRNLENLTLGFTWYFDNSSLSHLIKRRGSMLKSFSANFCESSTEAYTFLTQCPNIIKLNLCRAEKMKACELMHIKELNLLETLKIRGTEYLHAGNFVNLFEGTEYLNLVHLEFFSCKIDDVVLTYMTASCPLLKKFYLCCCSYVTNVGIEHIINCCGNMKHLFFRDLEITYECLVKIPEMMPNLVRLNISCCRTRSKNVLQYLKSKKPNLEIFLGYSCKKFYL